MYMRANTLDKTLFILWILSHNILNPTQRQNFNKILTNLALKLTSPKLKSYDLYLLDENKANFRNISVKPYQVSGIIDTEGSWNTRFIENK